MKLRIRGNSIRLRLTKSEVERLGATGGIEDAVEFGTGSSRLRYELRTTPSGGETRAKFEDHCLSVSIPGGDADSWIRSEQVGIEAMQPIGDGNFLRILVEKDFACLAERAGEDDSDTFPIQYTANC